MSKSQAYHPGAHILVGRVGPVHREQCRSAETLQERCEQYCGASEEGKAGGFCLGWGTGGTAERE